MKNKRKILLVVFVLIVLSLSGCGTSYVCEKCGAKTEDAYYDPFEEGRYFCAPCAREYFRPFPISNWKVED